MKTFIFRIIAIFSVLFAAQNAFAYGAVAAVSQTVSGTFRSAIGLVANEPTQQAANDFAIRVCNESGNRSGITADCTVRNSFVNSGAGAAFVAVSGEPHRLIFALGGTNETIAACNAIPGADCSF
ncbi:MAG: hypothetical protein HAW59_02435, partial [Betaproteobacteria bacterium]|nr:hypothetical protein [Betaproteobacteria bacterium]